jgi:hypothetical protein
VSPGQQYAIENDQQEEEWWQHDCWLTVQKLYAIYILTPERISQGHMQNRRRATFSRPILYNPKVQYHVHLDYIDIYVYIIHQSVSRVSNWPHAFRIPQKPPLCISLFPPWMLHFQPIKSSLFDYINNILWARKWNSSLHNFLRLVTLHSSYSQIFPSVPCLRHPYFTFFL